MTALKKWEYRNKLIPDKESEYIWAAGPALDRVDNFVAGGATAGNSRKRKSNGVHSSNSSKPINVDNSVVKYIPNNHPEIAGKRARRSCVITGKYGVYFPCDGTTEETS